MEWERERERVGVGEGERVGWRGGREREQVNNKQNKILF